MNIKPLLAALPVLCIPAAGSLLRFPDPLLYSLPSETAPAHGFIHIPSPMPDAFSEIPLISDEVVSFPPTFPTLTTDLEVGSNPALPADPGSLDAFLRHLDPSEPLFLLIGICLLSAGLRIPIPSLRPGRYRPRFSSHRPQIIHLTRPHRLP